MRPQDGGLGDDPPPTPLPASGPVVPSPLASPLSAFRGSLHAPLLSPPPPFPSASASSPMPGAWGGLGTTPNRLQFSGLPGSRSSPLAPPPTFPVAAAASLGDVSNPSDRRPPSPHAPPASKRSKVQFSLCIFCCNCVISVPLHQRGFQMSLILSFYQYPGYWCVSR